MSFWDKLLKSEWTAKTVLFILNLIERLFINKLPEPVKEGVKLAFGPAKRSIQVLVDADPNDAEQLKEIWLEFIDADEPWDYTEGQLRQLVLSQITEDKYQKVVLPLLPVVLDTLHVLVDKNPENKEQLNALFETFVTSDDFDDFLINLLELIVKSKVAEEDVDFIIEIISGLLFDNDK